jgi:predicted Zn-dependent protease
MTSNNKLDLETGLQRAIDLYHEGRVEEAIANLSRLGRRFPASPKLWGYLGFLHREADDSLAASLSFAKTVALSPKSERASLGLFFALLRLKRFDDALKELGRFTRVGKPKQYLSFLSGAPKPSKSNRRRDNLKTPRESRRRAEHVGQP